MIFLGIKLHWIYINPFHFLVYFRHYGAQAKEVQIPPKPKKPLTPYFRFLGQVRTDVQKQNPNLKTTGENLLCVFKGLGV